MYIKGLGIQKLAESPIIKTENDPVVKEQPTIPTSTTPNTIRTSTTPTNIVKKEGGNAQEKPKTKPISGLNKALSWVLNNPGATAGLTTGALLLATDPLGMIWRTRKPGDDPVNIGSLLGTGLIGGGLYAGLKYAPELLGKFKEWTTTEEDRKKAQQAYEEAVKADGKLAMKNIMISAFNKGDDESKQRVLPAVIGQLSKSYKNFDIHNLDTITKGAELLASIEDPKLRNRFAQIHKYQFKGLDPAQTAEFLYNLRKFRGTQKTNVEK